MVDRASNGLCYAGIGNRNMPPLDEYATSAMAAALEIRGWHLVSGGANGADAAFLDGVKNPRNATVWLPWKGFNGHGMSSVERAVYKMATNDQAHGDMEVLAKSVCNDYAWQSMGRARPLFVRNAFIIAQGAWRRPVDAVVCWNATRNKMRGGTNHALQVVERMSPKPVCINLADQNMDQALAIIDAIAKTRRAHRPRSEPHVESRSR